jgi:hypothetical protein
MTDDETSGYSSIAAHGDIAAYGSVAAYLLILD